MKKQAAAYCKYVPALDFLPNFLRASPRPRRGPPHPRTDYV